jgi:hypothetical protein
MLKELEPLLAKRSLTYYRCAVGRTSESYRRSMLSPPDGAKIDEDIDSGHVRTFRFRCEGHRGHDPRTLS